MKIKNFLTTLNNRGVAAVMAVFVLILFSLLGLVICPLFSTQSAGKVNFLQSQQALQIAEAGRQYAVWYLNTQDNLWATDWTPEQTLGRGTWRVKVEHDTGIIVTSKGYVSEETNFRAQRVVKMEGLYDIEESTHPIYNYALYVDKESQLNEAEEADTFVGGWTNIGGVYRGAAEAESTWQWNMENGYYLLTVFSGQTTDEYQVKAEGESVWQNTSFGGGTSWQYGFVFLADGAFTLQAKAPSIGNGYLDKIVLSGPLIFDENKYTLYTTEDNDGDADVHSNGTINFLSGSGQVIDGSVYSASQIDTSGWTGIPWRVGAHPNSDVVLPPYMGEETKEYYKQRAQAQGLYFTGDLTITGEIQLRSILSGEATIAFAEGDITIGEVIYRGPQWFGQNYIGGVGTIVAGGQMIINGYIEPHSGIVGQWNDRCALALVSFGDVSYQKEEEPDYPPFYEGARELHIKDGGVDSTAEKVEFTNREQCTISYIRERGRLENRRRGYITAGIYNNPAVYNHAPMNKRSIGGNRYEYWITFNIPDDFDDEWCYFYVEIEHDFFGLEHRSGAWMIVGTQSSPEHGIWTYRDNTFLESSKTVAFSNGATVYLEVYANDPSTANFNQIEVNNYTAFNPPNLPRTGEPDGTDSIRCRFTLPASTEDWWYNLKVTTTEGYTFRKQIYIVPAGAVVDVYSCIYADDKFRVPESSNLKITGNLATRRGLTLIPDNPLTNLEIEKDTEAFRGDLPWQQNDPHAVPGAVSFSYTWKEVKD